MKTASTILLTALFSTICNAEFEIETAWQVFDKKFHLSPPSEQFHLNTQTETIGGAVTLFNKSLRLWGQAGAGQAEVDKIGIDGSLENYWIAGIDGVFYRAGDWSLGVGGRVQYFATDDFFPITGRDMGNRLELWQYQLRPTITWEHKTLRVYGGPSVTWWHGDVTFYWGGPVYVWDIRETQYGGFLGADWQIHKHIVLKSEGEWREDGTTVRLGLAVPF